jgi:hypothetical protein
MGNPLTDAVDRAPPTRSWLCLPRCSSDRFTPPAADSRDGAHRRKALPPPPPNRWLHTPQLGARPCPAIHVSASRCSRRRIPTGSSADAARRLRRYRRDRQPVWSGIVNWRSTRSSAGRAAASSHTVVRNGFRRFTPCRPAARSAERQACGRYESPSRAQQDLSRAGGSARTGDRRPAILCGLDELVVLTDAPVGSQQQELYADRDDFAVAP